MLGTPVEQLQSHVHACSPDLATASSLVHSQQLHVLLTG